MMKRALEFVVDNWISLTVGFLLAACAFQYAYECRGYIAIGSEWIVLPFTVFVFKGVKKLIREEIPELLDTLRSDEE